MQSATVAHFPTLVRCRAPKGLPEALAEAARLKGTTASEYMRQALIASLMVDGVRLRDGRVERSEKAAA